MKAIKWDASKHPRDRLGQFRRVDLKPGEHQLIRKGEVVGMYFINEVGQLENGSQILHHAAQGQVMGSFKDDRPLERIHIVGTEDGEQMAIAASGNTTFGVINHDKAAPPEAFSFNRGHDFQTVGNLPEGETAFGGAAARLSGRPDGQTYDTLTAQKAQRINEEAFNSPNSRICHADPGEIAQKTSEARHYYMDKLGMSESEARNAPVYVYADKKGDIHIKPAYKVDDFGNLKFVRSPNSHGGTPTVKLDSGELTRMTRAMQADGIDEVSFTVSRGTNISKTGKPLNNALHFRKENWENPSSGDQTTMWGTIEQKNQGVQRVAATGPLRNPDGSLNEARYAEYRQKVQEVRDRAAAPFRNPKDADTAAKLIRRKTGDFRIPTESVSKTTDGNFTAVTNKGMGVKFDGNGDVQDTWAHTPKAFRNAYNTGRTRKVSEKDVVKTEDGRFGVRTYSNPRTKSNPQWRYYDAHGNEASDRALRNGKVYRYDDAGRLVETAETPNLMLHSYNE